MIRAGASWGRMAGGVALVWIAMAAPWSAQGPVVTPPSQQNSSTLATGDQPMPGTLQPDLVTPEAPDTYVIGPNDLLAINVLEMPDLTAQVRVDGNGQFRLPLLAQPVVASGRTAPQLAGALRQDLMRQGVAVDPQVRVTVRQVMSRPVVVAGAVRAPVVLQAARPISLLEALSRAGGANADAGQQVLLARADGTAQTFAMQAILQNEPPAAGVMMNGGETLRVLPARMIYVVGALQKPGAFPLAAGEPISVLKAVALAQGFSTANPPDRDKSEIIRQSPLGVRTEIPVRLDRVLRHKDPDPMLEAGDILYVPENGRRRFINAALFDVGQALVLAVGYTVAH